MLAYSAFLVLVSVIFAIEAPRLWRRKQKKELWAFVILLMTGTILGTMQILIHKIPNPLDLIVVVYKPVSDALAAWLQ